MSFSFSFEGDHHTFGRVVTGHYSLDHALAGGKDREIVGFPTRTLVEIDGEAGIGKTTLALHLLGKISAASNHLSIACADLENQDEDMVQNVLSNAGYNAPLHWVNPPINSKGVVDDRDEAILQELLVYVNQEPPCLGFLDSIASIASMAEVEGDIGDANIGRKAFPMAQFSRRASRVLRSQETDSCIIMTNHLYDKIGTIGPAKQYTSPGGMVKNYMRHVHIRVSTPWQSYLSSGSDKVKAEWEEGWILHGNVKKNRTGVDDTTFQVFVYGGWGIHDGMTSLIDCLASGLAKIKAGNKVVMDGVDYGLLKKIIEKERDNPDFFRPFYNELRANSVDTVSDGEDE